VQYMSIIIIWLILLPSSLFAGQVKIRGKSFEIQHEMNRIILTKAGRVISQYDFSFSHKGKGYNTSVVKSIPVDIDSDGTDELIVQLRTPDMMSPNLVILYFENKKIKKLHEGINLFAHPYSESIKTDLHTIAIGADVKFEFKSRKVNDADLRQKLLSSVSEQQIGIVLFPEFYHLQMGPWPFLVDARHLHYSFENCEKISFGDLTDVRIASKNLILLISQGLLTILKIESINKIDGAVGYAFFNVGFDDPIKSVKETKDSFLVLFDGGELSNIEKSKIVFNRRNNGKWWRTKP